MAHRPAVRQDQTALLTLKKKVESLNPNELPSTEEFTQLTHVFKLVLET